MNDERLLPACGYVYDIRNVACPRCGRCPECGCKCRAGEKSCRCGHPTDEQKLLELAQRLDPSLPSNQKTIRSMEKDWQRFEQWQRINRWKLTAAACAFVCVAGIPCMFVTVTLCQLLGISTGWATSANLLFWILIFVRVLPDQILKGHFSWLLRKEERYAPGPESS